MAIFHYTVKIVGRSKGKSIISASAYLNGDVMKNEETGRISYYTSKKEVVYTSLLMCENAPQEWQNVPAENIRRFQKSVRYKRADNQNAALEKFKLTFQKQRLWNEVLRIEKSSDAQLGRSFEFSLPKEWSRQEQIDYTTEYIQKTFVDKGMCADWSIHDKGDGNPHVHLLVTMRPFNSDHSWGNKEIKDWEFVRDENGNIVVDESHPDWWQDKKDPDRHGIRIPVLDENGVQKVGTRNRKQWKRVLTDATGWNNPKNCELWRSEWANVCNAHLKTENHIDHRSYARQGKLEIPTIHEGADARKIDEKFQNGQTSSTSWKVEENQIIKRQNALLDKIQISFGKVSSALTQWKERLRDIRRKPGSHSHDGDNDKPDRGTAEYYGRDGTGIAGTGQAAPVFSGAEPEFKKLKQRIIQAAKSFARYRRTALTDRATENQNRTVGKRESAMAGINAEAEQREQLIAETEQRIADLKQHLENVGQVEELLLMTEQMQDELDQKDQTIQELNRQLSESLTLNEKLNSENRAENIEALRTRLRQTEERLTSETDSRKRADAEAVAWKFKYEKAEQEKLYAQTHQKTVEVAVEKKVPYEKCEKCDRTAYRKAKEKCDSRKSQLEKKYKNMTIGYESILFLLAWYSITTTLFTAILSPVFLNDCIVFFGALGKGMGSLFREFVTGADSFGQLSSGIPNSILSGIVYWLIAGTVMAILFVITGWLIIGIGYQVGKIYRKYCWDIISIVVAITSTAVVIYFGEWIKNANPINLIVLLLLSHIIYIGIRCYVKDWMEERGYY